MTSRSNRRTGLVVATILIALLIAYGVTSVRNLRDDGGRAVSGVDTGGESNDIRAEADMAVASDDRVLHGTELVSDGMRPTAMAMLNAARSARAFHDELRKHIDDGDIAALAALDELQSRCGSISGAQGRQYAEQDVAISKSDDEFEARRVALNVLTAFCDRPYVPGELKSEMKLVEEAMRAAAAKGDEAAMIWLAVHMGEAVSSELMLRHVSSGDPWIAEMALIGLSNTNDSRVKAVRERVFSDWRGSNAASEVETIVLAAAKWRACDLGLPCGSGGYYQHYQCLYGGGYCEPGLGVKDYIRRQLSGRQYEAMLRYIASLDALAKSTP
jgi:hypothetical protein